MLLPFGIFCVNLYFSHFGVLYQGNSGNLVAHLLILPVMYVCIQWQLSLPQNGSIHMHQILSASHMPLHPHMYVYIHTKSISWGIVKKGHSFCFGRPYVCM
jgi:hypothetical protein